MTPRPEHAALGDPCQTCGSPASNHRVRRAREREAYLKEYNAKRPGRKGLRPHHPEMQAVEGKASPLKKIRCLGIDGEGYNHGSVYAYMACASTSDTVSTLENLRGIKTHQALDFLLDLPKQYLKFGFSMGYDYTKILQDLENKDLWLLCRPEERTGEDGPPTPVYFSGGGSRYELNLLGGRLSIRRMDGHDPRCADPECLGCRPGPRTILWDIFKFFQSSFVKACLDWAVISPDDFELLSEMKKKRPEFAKPRNETDREWLEIKEYCQLECRKMAELAEKLIQAHDEAGLKLKQYYGAGSTGAAMLDKMNARKFIRHLVLPERSLTPSERSLTPSKGSLTPSKTIQKRLSLNKPIWKRIEYEPDLLRAIACAFFGGRFEISEYGPIPVPCHSYDISSAYPYAFTFLPCLVHGHWRKLKAERNVSLHLAIERAQVAIVRYELPWVRGIGKVVDETSKMLWGPFPFRVDRGSEPLCSEGDIVFPVTSGGGWVCQEEYLAGCFFAPNVVATEAWIYETKCDCKVLREVMPGNYKLRCSWGKEGKGQVAKLGQNSCYGKAAQTKGKMPPYQEFVWALLTTGSCRAQLLRAMTQAKEHIRLLATDGIISTKELKMETPRDTGTYDTIDIKSGKKKPLGGWEHKVLQDGVFLIRPGIAFPLGTEKLDEKAQKKAEAEFKARGIGKHVLMNLRKQVTESWYERGPGDHHTEKQMFFGMKSCVYSTPTGMIKRSDRYGKFGMQDQVISYKPTPKRPAVQDGRFLTWAFGPKRMSIPYGPILGEPKTITPLMKAILAERAIHEDQDDSPDLDIREF